MRGSSNASSTGRVRTSCAYSARAGVQGTTSTAAPKPSRRKSCEHPSCPKQPAFSFNGSGVRFCAQHRLKGMVNVRNRRCEGANCTKEPYFGDKGGKARFCASHKPRGDMVDVRHRRCEFISCHKQPNYGYEGQRACFCSTHKLPAMVDVKHRRCAESGCRGYSSFAFPGSKEKFCAAHRREGMLPSGRGRTTVAATGTTIGTPVAPASAPISTISQNVMPARMREPARLLGDSAIASTRSTGSGPEVGRRSMASPVTAGHPRSRRSLSDDDDERDGRRGHKRRGSTGSPFHYRTREGVGSRNDNDTRCYTRDCKGAVSMDVDEDDDGGRRQHQAGFIAVGAGGGPGGGGGSDRLHDLETLRRRSCPADFGNKAKMYVAQQLAHQRRSQGMRASNVFAERPHAPSSSEAAVEERERDQWTESSDDLVQAGGIPCLPFRMPKRTLSSSWSWSAHAGMSTPTSGEWPQAPFAGDRSANSFTSYRDEDASPCSRGQGGSGSSSGGDGGDDARGGYPALLPARFRYGGADGGEAAQGGRSATAGGPSRECPGEAVSEAWSVRRGTTAGTARAMAPTWTENALVNRQLPGMSKTPPAEGTATASLNPHWRGGMPKSRSVLAGGRGPSSSSRWSSLLARRNPGGAGCGMHISSSHSSWPSAGASKEFGTRSIGGGSGGVSRVHAAPASPASTSVVTLTGSHKRLMKYERGAGSLGPTLETLEPRWGTQTRTAISAPSQE